MYDKKALRRKAHRLANKLKDSLKKGQIRQALMALHRLNDAVIGIDKCLDFEHLLSKRASQEPATVLENANYGDRSSGGGCLS